MSATVELPLWLVIVATTLATIGLIDRLLVPTARWMLRSRVNRAIDELNTHLKLHIQPFKLNRRESLADRLVFDQEVVKAAQAHATEHKEPIAITMERVKAYSSEIVPNFSAYAYFKFGAKAARWLSTLLYRVRLGYIDHEALARIDPDSTVVFVMNHRSNMDYVLVTYMASASSALSYAVGEWARVWGLQGLIKAMGAYFIRRDSGDPLYRKVLARYVQIATMEGVTQAVFPEGGLTRDGKLRPAKLGLLGYMVGRFDAEGPRDVVFIPVGLNYDRVLEDRNLTAPVEKEAGGKAKRITGWGFARYLGRALRLASTGKWYRNGYAAVSFGAPLSLRGWVADNSVDFRRLDEAGRFVATEKLGAELMTRVAGVVPVLPVSLIAAIMQQAGETGLDEIALKARASELMSKLEKAGVHVHLPRGDLDYAVSAGLRMLVLRDLVREADGVFSARPDEKVLIAYYANAILHHLEKVAPSS
ncbi:MAG: 1-acyl-sn-glycerol-3-phosphate acyltransferase [Bosea sp. (in: a-proteobacteria)]